MLELEIFLVEGSADAQPLFEIVGCLDDVHSGNDNDGQEKKSNMEEALEVSGEDEAPDSKMQRRCFLYQSGDSGDQVDWIRTAFCG